MNISDISRHLLISVLIVCIIVVFLPHDYYSPSKYYALISSVNPVHGSQTTLAHLVFGLLGSEGAWHHRQAYIESWWRPNATRGLLYLDKPPSAELLPWSPTSPRYKVSENLTAFLEETKAAIPTAMRIVHGIKEVVREMDDGNLRWLVMGDDDSILFVDNLVDVLAQYDHTQYHYFGIQSEFIMSNFWFSFNQGYGGAGFILSYPLARALAEDMENCLTRTAQLRAADHITMTCIADIGVGLTPLRGLHQIDMHGDISGFLSAHPRSPLLSLHHFDYVDPIFPSMDRAHSARHLMKAADADQSRMLQQTICHHKQNHWSFSIAWGYSAHIYERIMPWWILQQPIQTFQTWVGEPRPPPEFMFNTREPTKDPCDAPHIFFFQAVERTPEGILTTYARAMPRELPPCWWGGSVTAENVSEIRVLSPLTKRREMDRAECCDIVLEEGKAEVKFRQCLANEVIV